jgi:tetratricopeptide (TPR) repeat protein
MNKRLSVLEQVTGSGTADAFAWYALGMEYRKEGRPEDALRAFESLREKHPDYLPMYLMAGQLLVELARYKDAREWLAAGIELARATGDGKTLGELEAELVHANPN